MDTMPTYWPKRPNFSDPDSLDQERTDWIDARTERLTVEITEAINCAQFPQLEELFEMLDFDQHAEVIFNLMEAGLKGEILDKTALIESLGPDIAALAYDKALREWDTNENDF